MRTVRSLRRQTVSSVAAISLLLGLIAPSAMPALASAAILQSRSIEMSSATVSATGVDYTITFTPSGTSFESVVINWCGNSPVAEDTCTAPTGFDASGATIDASSALGIGTAGIDATNSNANTTIIDGTSANTTTTPVTIELDGVNNPTDTVNHTFYARIYTISTAPAYDSAGTHGYKNATTIGDHLVDTGGVALSTVDDVGVSATVREAMTFCVSGSAPLSNCASTTAPNIALGETSGSGLALSSSAVSHNAVYAQLSTNAVNGAVVNVKNNNGCGGLKLFNETQCIAPQNNSANSITAGQALFGLEVGTAAAASDAGGSNSGTLLPSTNYSGSSYYLAYNSNNLTGVTSPYGSPVFNSNSTTVNEMNVPITFGASASNATAAGSYSASLDMVATGTF